MDVRFTSAVSVVFTIQVYKLPNNVKYGVGNIIVAILRSQNAQLNYRTIDGSM